MRHRDDELTALVREGVEPMGYEVLGVEHLNPGAGNALLRAYIDRDGGITLDDCELVSRQLSAVLDVEDPIPGQYQLEVSSPGLDRPLFTPEQIARHTGLRARVRLAHKREGRRRFEGVIVAVDETALKLEVDGEIVTLPLDGIDTARLVPEI